MAFPLRIFPVPVALLLGLAACDGESAVEPDPRRLDILSDSVLLAVGEVAQLEFSYSSINPGELRFAPRESGIVQAQSDGKLVGIGSGVTQVYLATLDGAVKDSVRVEVFDFRANCALTLRPERAAVNVGATFKFLASSGRCGAWESRVTFSSSHPEVATVDSAGVTFAKALGNATITARLEKVPSVFAVSVLQVVPIT